MLDDLSGIFSLPWLSLFRSRIVTLSEKKKKKKLSSLYECTSAGGKDIFGDAPTAAVAILEPILKRLVTPYNLYDTMCVAPQVPPGHSHAKR